MLLVVASPAGLHPDTEECPPPAFTLLGDSPQTPPLSSWEHAAQAASPTPTASAYPEEVFPDFRCGIAAAVPPHGRKTAAAEGEEEEEVEAVEEEELTGLPVSDNDTEDLEAAEAFAVPSLRPHFEIK